LQLKDKIFMKLAAIFMAIILLSSMGLVNITLADDSQDAIFSPLLKSHFGKDHFGATVGYKAWFNTWDLPMFFRGKSPSEQDLIATVRSETEISHIPVLLFRYNNFFISGSYFPKTDYNLSKMKVLYNIGINNDIYLSSPSPTHDSEARFIIYDPNEPKLASSPVRAKIPIEYRISAERSEWDITAGYHISQNLAITVGYKNIKRLYSQQVYRPSFPVIDVSGEEPISFSQERTGKMESDSEGNGVTLGLIGSVPLGRGFGLYGNFAYGWLETDEYFSSSTEINGKTIEVPEAPSFSHDNNYYLGEMGLAYSPRFKTHAINAASFYLAYRFQHYDFEDAIASGQTARDSTDGLVLGVNLSF
jgi:hypothetical protein